MVKTVNVINFQLGKHDSRTSIDENHLMEISKYISNNSNVNTLIIFKEGVYGSYYLEVDDDYTYNDFSNSSLMKKIDEFRNTHNLYLKMFVKMSGDKDIGNGETLVIECGNVDYPSQITKYFLKFLGIKSISDNEYRAIRSEITYYLDKSYRKISSKFVLPSKD